MMPYEATAPWSTSAIAGVFRFLQRVWHLKEKISEDKKMTADDTFQLNDTIQKVERDLELIKNNTAIAFIMTWLNYLSKQESISKEEYKTLLVLLAPFAPHVTEELWNALGEEFSIHHQTWPAAKKGAQAATSVNIPVQVNGKVRTILKVPSNSLDQASVEKLALADETITRHLEGKTPKTIYIQGKILNLVI
jgi:leucyl-tRNA synthetase